MLLGFENLNFFETLYRLSSLSFKSLGYLDQILWRLV